MTNVPEQKTKRADELEPGDWLAPGWPVDDAVRVLFTYRGEPGETFLAFEGLDGAADRIDIRSELSIALATEAEVAEVKERAGRLRLADELRQLAAAIVRHELPLPTSLRIAVDVESRAAVAAVAAALDVPTEPWITAGLHASWPKGRKPYEPGVEFLVYTSEKADEAEPAPVPSGAVADEVREGKRPEPCWHGEIEPGRECPGTGPDCGPAF